MGSRGSASNNTTRAPLGTASRLPSIPDGNPVVVADGGNYLVSVKEVQVGTVFQNTGRTGGQLWFGRGVSGSEVGPFKTRKESVSELVSQERKKR
jgi:hypothetical protein